MYSIQACLLLSILFNPDSIIVKAVPAIDAIERELISKQINKEEVNFIDFTKALNSTALDDMSDDELLWMLGQMIQPIQESTSVNDEEQLSGIDDIEEIDKEQGTNDELNLGKDGDQNQAYFSPQMKRHFGPLFKRMRGLFKRAPNAPLKRGLSGLFRRDPNTPGEPDARKVSDGGRTDTRGMQGLFKREPAFPVDADNSYDGKSHQVKLDRRRMPGLFKRGLQNLFKRAGGANSLFKREDGIENEVGARNRKSDLQEIFKRGIQGLFK
uniref:Uncharacterized protein n=1 Tax=Ciona savignyi TaxID=51511 RepID=H2ZB87_CIOSA